VNSEHPPQNSASALQRHGLRLPPAGRNRDVGVAGGAPCWRRDGMDASHLAHHH
jgi:hypothetical protein